MERRLVSLARPFGFLALVLGLAAVGATVFYAPVERIQGPIQKIMYLHVPSAITSYVAFITAAVAGALFLWKRSPAYDRVARSSAEIGLLFCSVVLITGPLWGKPVWGVWWSWDARLTSTLLLWLIFVGYFVVRRLAPGEQGGRFASVVAIIGVLDIPFINVAAEKFQSLHPPNIMKSGGMTQEMHATLGLCILTVLVFYLYLLGKRIEVAGLSDRLEAALIQVGHDPQPAPLTPAQEPGTDPAHRAPSP